MKTSEHFLRLMNPLLSPVILLLVVQSLYGQAPSITGFTPGSGPVGTTVTLTGTNFNATAANNVVIFGATKAGVTTATATQLTVTVPAGATYSRITVLNTSTGLLACSPANFMPTFTPNKGSIATSDFSTPVSFPTTGQAVFSAIGDLDGDGKTDLAVPVYDDAKISVFRNTSTQGAISYATEVDFTTGQSPEYAAIGDLNGDGKLDIAVANLDGTVSVFRNTSTSGAISFATKVDLSAGGGPQGVAITDLDGDGKADVAVVNGSKLSIFRNTSTTGNIEFSGKTDYTAGSEPFYVAIGDLDGDRKPEVAVANRSSASLSVFRNVSSVGTITLSAKQDFATGSYPIAVSIGDLDGDGKEDLAVARYQNSMIQILRNTTTAVGTISMAALVDIVNNANANMYTLPIGDLDGDGKPDLAVANISRSTISVFRNTSTPGAISYTENITFNTGASPVCVRIGDVDGDGKPELVVSNMVDHSISIYRNNPILSNSPTITSFTPTSGPVGTSITITGTNFSATPTNNIVKFNGTDATVTASTTTSITTVAPAGASKGKITVTVGGSTATSAVSFTVTCTNPDKPTITHTSNSDFTSSTLTSSVAPEGGTYQWYLNGTAIDGATSQHYTTSDVGAYTVRINVAGGCQATSDAFEIVITDVEQPTAARDILLHPNPVTDWLTLSLGEWEGKKDISLYQATGKLLTTHNTSGKEAKLDVADYTVGMYIVKVRTANAVSVLRFIKQ